MTIIFHLQQYNGKWVLVLFDMKIQFSIKIEFVNGKDIELVGGLTIVLGGGGNVHDINHISSI